MRLRLLVITAVFFIALLGELIAPLSAGAANYGNVNIIDDSTMNNTASMTATQVQSFLNSFSGNCLGGSFTTPDPLGYSGNDYQFGGNVNAGTAIRDIAVRYNINPQVVLATLEKEQGLVSRNGSCDYSYQGDAPNGTNCGRYDGSGNPLTGPNYCSYACRNTPVGGCVTVAVGYGCPGYCNKRFSNFSWQISGATWLFRFAQARALGQLTGYAGYDTGDSSVSYSGPMTAGYRQRSASAPSIYYDGSYTDADGNTMYITNGATASMLNFTPFYARSYTSNRLFSTFYNRWFGSPTNGTNLINSLGTNTLVPGTVMNAGDYIVSPNGRFVTVMQYDGNLVTYAGTRVIWQSGTYGSYGAHAKFQADGNLVIYNANESGYYWLSYTWGSGADNVTLGNDGMLLIAAGSTQKWNSSNAALVSSSAANYIGTQLSPGATLHSRDYLKSPDGRYWLVMQSDGNLAAYTAEGNYIWNSRTWNNPGAYATMQNDGNLVVFNASGTPLWNSRTWTQGPSVLKMQSDGNLVVYRNSDNAFTWSSWTYMNDFRVDNYIDTQLSSGATLHAGDYLRSPDWRYTLVMQNDGNLVVYYVDRHAPIWNSRTWNNPGAYATMQNDGNLVVFNASGTPLWNSRTWTQGPSVLKMQSDGNLVVYRNSDNAFTWDSAGW